MSNRRGYTGISSKVGSIADLFEVAHALRRIYVLGGALDHPFFDEEVARQKRLRAKYLLLRDRHPDKSPEWWFDTHGIDVAEMREIAGE